MNEKKTMKGSIAYSLLIGDEQEPTDVQWGPGEHGITLKAWPEWFLAGKPRPSAGYARLEVEPGERQFEAQ